MVDIVEQMRTAATKRMDLDAIMDSTKVKINTGGSTPVYVIASGDLRPESNQTCWEAQKESELEFKTVVENLKDDNGVNPLNYTIQRAHHFNSEKGHGFIDSQAMGNEIIGDIPDGSLLVVQESVWQYSHHVLGALEQFIKERKGRVITVANYSGTWPGLVGMSNLNASLVKRGLELGQDFHTVWAEDFHDETFQNKIRDWLVRGTFTYDRDHIHTYDGGMEARVKKEGYDFDVARGQEIAQPLKRGTGRAIMLGLDFYCMGMDNAFFAPEKLSPLGIGHEFLSQSELLSEMGALDDPKEIKKYLYGKLAVTDEEGWKVIQWCIDKGMKFNGWDPDYEAELNEAFEAAEATGSKRAVDAVRKLLVRHEKGHITSRQLLEQGKMYVAAARLADRFGADVIGIQCQQGLKNCCAASDLPEGLLNSSIRPDVWDPTGSYIIRQGEAIPCFNEVDQGCGVDLILSKRLWDKYSTGIDGMASFSANQEDVRWSRKYTGTASAKDTEGNIKNIHLDDREVWIDELSGSCPADHIKGGWEKTFGNRQPYYFFKSGGSTLSGYAKEGEVVISRVYQNHKGEMCINLMRGGVVNLPEAETMERLNETTKEWPIKSLVRYGVSRDQMILHPSNHETVMYAENAEMANKLMFAKAAMAKEMGMKVEIWGSYDLKDSLEYQANLSDSICSDYFPVPGVAPVLDKTVEVAKLRPGPQKITKTPG